MLTLRSVFLMLFICLPVQADNLTLEQDIFNLSVDVKSLLLKYYHVQADEGNNELTTELYSRLETTAQLHNQVQSELGGRFLQHSQNARQHWQAFNRHLGANLKEILESAYPELQVVTLMRESADAMIQELDTLSQLLQQEEGVDISAAETWSRQQKRLLQGVVELYIERAASSMGAPLTIDGPSLQQLSAQFKQGLDLYPEDKASATAKRAINRIRGQWLFIEKSTSDESAKLVPYLVMRYTDSIITRLTQLSA